MAYRKNVTDKQQNDIETALNDSAIRVQLFDGRQGQVGLTKMVPAYDPPPGIAAARLSPNDVVRRPGKVIGSHNDKPHRFEMPGKA